jgi:hypothetical protein
MADPKTIAAQLRELATGRVEWRVADPITGAHCIEFGKGNKAERQAKAWLRNLRLTQPSHRFANYVVRDVRTFTALERTALEAAALLDAAAAKGGSPDAQQECDHSRATGDEQNGHCPDCGVSWQTMQATGTEDLRDVVGVAGGREYPECSGDPQSCPENEGHGCCGGNRGVEVVRSDETAPPSETNLMAFLDAGDAGRAGEEWLSRMARAVGIERGRIERFTGHMGEPQADAHTAMLWDGPQPLASYTVVRDDFNRAKLLLWTRNAHGVDQRVTSPSSNSNGGPK